MHQPALFQIPRLTSLTWTGKAVIVDNTKVKTNKTLDRSNILPTPNFRDQIWAGFPLKDLFESDEYFFIQHHLAWVEFFLINARFINSLSCLMAHMRFLIATTLWHTVAKFDTPIWTVTDMEYAFRALHSQKLISIRNLGQECHSFLYDFAVSYIVCDDLRPLWRLESFQVPSQLFLFSHYSKQS